MDGGIAGEISQTADAGGTGDGCAFVLDADRPRWAAANFCNAPPRPGSAYCPDHHALCRLAEGSAAEAVELREIEALALVVGGRLGRDFRAPPEALLRRLERAGRLFSRSYRS